MKSIHHKDNVKITFALGAVSVLVFLVLRACGLIEDQPQSQEPKEQTTEQAAADPGADNGQNVTFDTP